MYASRTTQFIVGIFAVLGIAALGYLSMRLGRIELFPAPGYTLDANFDDISGLKVGDQVQLAGVPIGKVANISLQPDGERARIDMRLSKGVAIDSEAIAAINTSGLIGDKYVAIELGGGDPLKDGATIRHTQSSNPGSANPGCPPGAANPQRIGSPGTGTGQKRTK